MDRFFIAYRIGNNQNTKHLQKDNNKDKEKEKISKSEKTTPTATKDTIKDKVVYDYMTEWLYKSINSF